MELETLRLHLRPFIPGDVCDEFVVCSQPDVLPPAGLPIHQTVADTEALLDRWMCNPDRLAIVWKETGRVIGHLSIKPDSEAGRADTRELGCALRRDYHRRGIMTEAIQAVLAALFASETVAFVWACCFQDNEPSRRMIEKNGFVFQQAGTYYSKAEAREKPSYEYCLSRTAYAAARETAASRSCRNPHPCVKEF